MSIALVILIPLIFLFGNCVNAVEIIDSFKSMNDIIIDGKWTSSEEWNGSSEELLIFGNGTGTAYLRLLNDDDYQYALVDFVTYNDTKTGDICMVVFDTKNDGGTSVKSDDLAVLIRWNTPTEIYSAIQWEGWVDTWVALPSDFEAESSKDIENNPYSTDPHLIFEFKIPKSYFEPSIVNLGFISMLICDNKNISAALPLLQFSHQPDDWYDLLIFNETIQIINDAQTALDAAGVSIENAESEGRTEGLSDAKSLFTQAEDSMELHDYIEVTSLAGQALTTADEATVPTQPLEDEDDDDTPGFELILVLLGITLVLFWKRRK
jgi:hypothetical protein